MYAIYKVINTVNGKSYIGITKRTLAVRWAKHVVAAKHGKKTALAGAIRKYGSDAFSIGKIDHYPTKAQALAAEIFYIALHRTKCPSGYNMTDGGDGVLALAAESAERRRVNLRTATAAAWSDPEIREKWMASFRSEGHVAASKAHAERLWADPGYRARAVAYQRSDAARALRSRQGKERIALEGALAALCAANKAAWSDPKIREKRIAAMKAGNQRPEEKARKSAAMRRIWSDVEQKARRSATMKEAANRADVRAANLAVLERPDVVEKRIAAFRITARDPAVIAKRSGANHSRANPVYADGVLYPTVTAAGVALGIKPPSVVKRIKNGWPGYSWADPAQRAALLAEAGRRKAEAA